MSEEYSIVANNPSQAEEIARDKFGNNYLIDDVIVTKCNTEYSKNVWIQVYKDTIKQHNDDWNLADIQVSEQFARQYFSECKLNSDCGWKTYEEFMCNYTADDTEDFYEYAMKRGAIVNVK